MNNFGTSIYTVQRFSEMRAQERMRLARQSRLARSVRAARPDRKVEPRPPRRRFRLRLAWATRRTFA